MHHHEHDHNHDHTHNDDAHDCPGCNGHHHDHNHDHGEGCGCGCHDHHHHEHVEIMPVDGLSILQQNFLLALHERGYLPIARFVLTCADNEEAQSVALAPVYIGDPNDDMDRVKSLGEALQALEDGGLLTLDYDIPLKGYAYGEYTGSELYAYFQKTVQEASGKPDFLFDTPSLELGSMALTDEGTAAVLAMMP